MKRCNQCGKILEDDVNYCPNCGLPYFSSCDTVTNSDQRTETYAENKPEYGKQEEAFAPKRRNIRSIIIGIAAAAVVLISVFILVFLSDTGKFRIPAFNQSADADTTVEEHQEVISDQGNAEADVAKEDASDEMTAEVTQQMNEGVVAQETDEDEIAVQDGPQLACRINKVDKYNDDSTRLLLRVTYETYYVTNDGYDVLDSSLRQWCADQSSELLNYADEVALDEIKSFEEFIIKYYGEDYYCQITLEYEPFYVDDKVVSLREYTYMDLGGVHGIYTYSGVTFDTEAGNVLALDDILSDSESFRAQAEAFILEELESVYAEELDQGYELTVAAMWDSPLWYLSSEGIVFIFNPYELGPFSMGEVLVTLPYADFENCLRVEYAGLYAAENEVTVEDGTAEDSTEFVNEHREEIALSRLDSTDRRATGLARLMSLDSSTFSELELNTYEATWDNGSANCIAELPEDHIRMYGYFDDEVWFAGVAFEIDGEICYFDWCYANVSLWSIQMYWNEETQQLQVMCAAYHGTGFYAPDLYIVKKDASGTWVSYRYGYEDYSEALEDRLLCVADANNEFITIVDTQTGEDIVSQVDASDLLSVLNVDQFYYGNISSFNLGETIVYACRYISDAGGGIGIGDPRLEFELILNQDENGDISFELGTVEAVYGTAEEYE